MSFADLAGGGGGLGMRALSLSPISCIFMQFSAKILPNNRFLVSILLVPSVWEILDPPLHVYNILYKYLLSTIEHTCNLDGELINSIIRLIFSKLHTKVCGG